MEAARGIEEMNSNIAGVSGATSETASSSGEVLQAARDLTGQSATLKQSVDSFLRDVKAA